jgi:2'-5' RNA ligase
VAVPLPPDLVGFVSAAQEALPRSSGVRLLGPEQLHLTLAFIGEVDWVKAAAAQAVVESVPGDVGGEVVLGGFVCFPTPKKARVVAMDIADEAGLLAELFERVMGGLEVGGVMHREKRPFRAHVTVARLRLPGPVQPMAESGHARFAVESVCLYRSELKREGAAYTVVARAALSGAEEREKA